MKAAHQCGDTVSGQSLSPAVEARELKKTTQVLNNCGSSEIVKLD